MAFLLLHNYTDFIKLDDQIRICYQFSRELEHSDLNLNRFEELMSEKEIFSFENLLKIC